MTIATFDQYIAAPKQNFTIQKTTATTTVAFGATSMFNGVGTPGAGVLAGVSTTQGVVPTSIAAGFHPIVDTGNTLYLTRVRMENNIVANMVLYDMLYKAGAYATNATTTVTAPPSFASRIPIVNGTPMYNTELWLEAATAITGVLTMNITYTNQSGVAGRTTGVITTASFNLINRLYRMPLQAGDTGVQSIQSVTRAGATAGSCNVLILRPLAEAGILVAGGSQNDNLVDTGMPQVFPGSALFPIITPVATSSGLPRISYEIAG